MQSPLGRWSARSSLGAPKSLKGKNEGMSYRVVKKVKVVDQRSASQPSWMIVVLLSPTCECECRSILNYLDNAEAKVPQAAIAKARHRPQLASGQPRRVIYTQ